MNVPLNRLAQKYRHETEDSDSEDDIPLMEISKRLKATEASSTDEENMDFDHNHSSQEMQIDEVFKNKKTKQSKRKKSSNVSEKDYLEIMKLLVSLIVDILYMKDLMSVVNTLCKYMLFNLVY